MADDLKDVVDRLDKLLKLTAASVLSDRSQREQIEFLDRIGFAPKEIAEMIGTTGNTVRVGLSGIRKKKKKRT